MLTYLGLGLLGLAGVFLGLSLSNSFAAFLLDAWPFHEFFDRDDRGWLRWTALVLAVLGGAVLLIALLQT